MKGAKEVKEVKVPTRTPILTRLSDVEPEAVKWLWPRYIPRGKSTLLEGDPGLGKTFFALLLAANVSKGDPFPGADGVPGERREPASVVYLSAEDGIADTLRPRLDAAGADVSRIHALEGWTQTDEEGNTNTGAVSLADMPMLESAVETVRPALVIIDPIQAYLGATTDMHRANEVRPLLSALGKLAERYAFAVVCIRHLNKAGGGQAIYRGLGSIDFAAAARSMLLFGEHPQDPHTRVVVHVKSSLAEQGPSLGFQFSEGALVCTGILDMSAEEMLAPRPSEEEGSKAEEAREFLLDYLREGPQPVKEIIAAATGAVISERTLKRVKGQLNIISERSSYGNEGKGEWVWTLPSKHSGGTLAPLREKPATDVRPQDNHTKNVAPLPEHRERRESLQERKSANALPLEGMQQIRPADEESEEVEERNRNVARGWVVEL